MSSSFRRRPPRRAKELPLNADLASARVLAECFALERELARVRRQRDDLLAKAAQSRDAQDALLRKHRELLGKHRELLGKHRDLRAELSKAAELARAAPWWQRPTLPEGWLTQGEPTHAGPAESDISDGDAQEPSENAPRPDDIQIQLDEPTFDGPLLAGTLTIAGWAIGPRPVARVDVLLDHTLLSSCDPDIERPDVIGAFPQFSGTDTPGFSTVVHLTEVHTGPHILSVRAVDTEGTTRELSREVWLDRPDLVAARPVCRRFTLYASSKGNYFFGEIRDLMAAGLRELGFEVALSDERYGFGEADWHVVIAPHEFFHLGDGVALRYGRLPFNLVLVNTEQPSTQWFAIAFEHFAAAQTVWDINFESALKLRAQGIPCQYLPLGYSPSFHAEHRAKDLPAHYGTCFLEPDIRDGRSARGPYVDRPIDVLFVGHLSERRERFLAHAAPMLAKHHCYLHLASAQAPIIPGQTTHMDTATVVGLTERSKIVLNVHHGRDQYFEWHRIVMHGIWHRALVVTEPCGAAPPFRSGVDFVEVPLEDIPAEIERLLSTSEGRLEAARTIDRAFETLTRRCRIADALRDAVLLLYGSPSFPPAFVGSTNEIVEPTEPEGASRPGRFELA